MAENFCVLNCKYFACMLFLNCINPTALAVKYLGKVPTNTLIQYKIYNTNKKNV